MENTRAIELLNYIQTFDGMDYGATKIALDKGIKALETVEKIKTIITEQEHYEVSNSFENPRPNKADYDAVSADKFQRIWQVVSEAEKQSN